MTYFWIKTIAGILVVATISTLIPSNLLKAFCKYVENTSIGDSSVP